MAENILSITNAHNQNSLSLYGNMSVSFNEEVSVGFVVNMFTTTSDVFTFDTSKFKFKDLFGNLVNGLVFGGRPGLFIELMFDPIAKIWYISKNNLIANEGEAIAETEMLLQCLPLPALTPVNFLQAKNYRIVLTANAKLANPTNMKPGERMTFVIVQGAGGSKVLSLDGGYATFEAQPPTYSAQEGVCDFVIAYKTSDGTVIWDVRKNYSIIRPLAYSKDFYFTTQLAIEAATANVENGQTVRIIRDGYRSEAPGSIGFRIAKPLNLRIKGIRKNDGSLPTLKLERTDRAAFGKAMINIEGGNNVVIEDLAVRGAVAQDSGNGTGVLINGGVDYVLMQNMHIHDNENGVRSGVSTHPKFDMVDILLENNGYSTLASHAGQTHNIYAGDASDNVFFQETGSAPFIQMVNSCPTERNTFIRRGTSTGSAMRLSNGLQSPLVYDNVFFNCSDTPVIASGTPAGAFNNNFTNVPLAVVHAGFIHSTNLIEGVSDARPTNNSVLVEAGSVRARSTRDMRGRNRGQLPDAGAVQLKDVIDLPGGNVSDITRAGQKVTITGTTTGAPTAGRATLTPVNVPYNNAVGQGPVNVTLGNGSFSVVFEDLKVGLYALSVVLENGGGPGNVVNNVGNISVTYASGSITSWALTGQKLTIEGTTSGNPVSATCTIPVAATNPGSAIQYGPVSVTLGVNTFQHVALLTPGSYGAPIVVFNTPEGTSFPAPGGVAVSIIDISGNPSAGAPAPLVEIENAAVVNGQVLVAGVVNVREDTSSVLEIFYIPEEGEIIDQGAIDYDPLTGAWNFEGISIEGNFKVRALITASDGQRDIADSNTLFEKIVVNASGTMLLPLK